MDNPLIFAMQMETPMETRRRRRRRRRFLLGRTEPVPGGDDAHLLELWEVFDDSKGPVIVHADCVCKFEPPAESGDPRDRRVARAALVLVMRELKARRRPSGQFVVADAEGHVLFRLWARPVTPDDEADLLLGELQFQEDLDGE